MWKRWIEGRSAEIIDPLVTLSNNISINQVMKLIHIGLLCVQENTESRPTMASVVVMLNANSFTLPKPSQPAFYLEYRESSPRDNETSSNSVTISELDPR